MPQVFISYSAKDIDFAQLCMAKLEAENIDTWIDHGSIHGGELWRESIDEGIQSSEAVIVIISPNSYESPYVTYEWAFALGLGVKIIPILLNETESHPRLSTIHHFNFTNALSRPWGEFIEEVKRASNIVAPNESDHVPDQGAENDLQLAKDLILEYLDDNGYRMMSFERVRENIDQHYTNEFLAEVIAQNEHIFANARIRGGKPGLKKRPGANN